MKKIVLYLLMISFCLANDSFSSSLKEINKAIQKKYNIHSLEDLQRLMDQNEQSISTNMRDVEDIPGNYTFGTQSLEVEVTVGTDQTLINTLSLMGMLPATSNLTADIADGDAVITTELHYMFLSEYLEDIFGGGDDDCNMNCQGEFDDYNDDGIDVSDEYCECCQDEYPLDEVCYGDDVEWIYFEKEDYADYTDSENWDIINDDVAIMRRDNQGFYNPLQEDSYANGGPAGTLWAGMSTHRAMDEGVSYTTWNEAVNSNPQSFIDDTLSIYCEAAHEYYDIHVLSFSGQQTGGGFSYYRTADPVHGDEENRDGHTGMFDLWQYDSGCDGWAGEWAITYMDDEEDTVASGVAPEGCESWTNVELELNREYMFWAGWTGDETADSEYSYLLGRTNDDGDVDTLSFGYAGQGNGFDTYLDDHDGDDFQPELLMMNFTFMEYMMLMFDADPDSLGIENPVVMGLSTNDDGTLAEVRAMLPMGDHEDGGVELYAPDSTAMVNAVGIDTALYAITFNNLALEDSLGNYGLNLTGSIAPVSTNLVANEPTSLSLPMDMLGDDDSGLQQLSFFSDFTVRDIYMDYEDDELSEVDTTYYQWYADADTLWLIDELTDDYYGFDSTYIDTQSFAYAITDTGIQLSGSGNPCDDGQSYDDCIDDNDDYFQMLGLDQLEDITNLVETMTLFLTQEDNAEPCVLGTVYVSEGHTSGDPEDYIEIYNSGDNECSLEGFHLDDNDELEDLTFGYLAIPAGGYWVGYRDSPGSFGSGLSSDGDIIVLADPAQENMLTVTLGPSVEMDDIELSQSFDADGVGCYTYPTPGGSNDACITLSITNPGLSAFPQEFKLYANFPNPFNPKTTIRFDVAESTSGITTLKIYDITGSVVAVLVNEQFQPGTYDLQWDAGQFASGVYFSELISGSFRQTKKMILLK